MGMINKLLRLIAGGRSVVSIPHFVQGEAASIFKMSKAKLVLHYFDFPFWRAEVCRLALHLGKVEFEDKKIKDFAEFKASGIAPLGQAPILEVDGKVVAQTGAIARYCGEVSGFYPKDDDFAAAKIDEIIDTATDITNLIGTTMRMADEKEKLAARAVLAGYQLPMYFAALEKIMVANGSTGFYVGSAIPLQILLCGDSWVGLKVEHWMEFPRKFLMPIHRFYNITIALIIMVKSESGWRPVMRKNIK